MRGSRFELVEFSDKQKIKVLISKFFHVYIRLGEKQSLGMRSH